VSGVCHSFRVRTERDSSHGSPKRAYGLKKVHMRYKEDAVFCSYFGDGAYTTTSNPP